MPLVKEDGSMPDGANSYADIADADAYQGDSISGDAWAALDATTKEKALISASRALDAQFEWHGRPVEDDQPMAWPRWMVRTQIGQRWPANRVPPAVISATCAYALFLAQNSGMDPASYTADDTVQEVTLGPITIKLATGNMATTARERLPAGIAALVRDWGNRAMGKLDR